ncbi:MAG: MBOAT family protein, partial [Verrucomicrobia bacterium]|nr:MBOAT family protein [Verrucomicrobiota bacterium]
LPRDWQNRLLVGASYVFYGWVHPWFLLPFLATTLVDYSLARHIEARPRWGKALLVTSIVSNLLLLGFFKYYNFFVENAAAALASLGWNVSLPVMNVILPAGISFYTFQSIGYVADVYRRRTPACQRLIDYAVFVAFFPQLIAGLMMRAGQLLHQVRTARVFESGRVQGGLLLLLWGFFQKLVIADNVAVIANKVFALQSVTFPILWTGVLAFCIQILADFSAYTDIARGTGRLMGFELSQNFNHPYIAESPADFWKRWHISLSTWIRDYIYIPLGGSRMGPARAAITLLFVFTLIGLWHGASWNFIFWGLYHGAITLVYRVAAWGLPRPVQTFPGARMLRIALMFVLTNIGWLIFREQNVASLWRALTLSPADASVLDWKVAAYLCTVVGLYSIPLLIHTAIGNVPLPLPTRSWVAQCATGLLHFVGILLLRSSVSTDFIYFQF